MSTNVITCKECHRQIATRHHSGNITVSISVQQTVLLVSGRLRVTCQCGKARDLEVQPTAA